MYVARLVLFEHFSLFKIVVQQRLGFRAKIFDAFIRDPVSLVLIGISFLEGHVALSHITEVGDRPHPLNLEWVASPSGPA